MRTPTTPSQRQLAAKLVADGYSLARTAEHLNLSVIQVRYALKSLGVKSPRSKPQKHIRKEPPPLSVELAVALESVIHLATEHGVSKARLVRLLREAV